MRISAFQPTFSLLFASILLQSVSFGQKPVVPETPAPHPAVPNVERTFRLVNPPPEAGFQEILTVLRTVGNIQSVAVDPASASVSVSGTSADIGLTEWTVRALDQPVVPDSEAKQIRDTAVHEYLVPGAKDDVVRMFYLVNITSAQGIQELLTVLRTVGAVEHVFQYTPLHAIAVRGPANQVSLSAWIIRELDQPPGTQTEGTHQFQSSDPQFPVVRAFYLANRTQKDMQEALTAVRLTVRIQRAFSYSARGVLILAGSSAQIEDAARMLTAKDRPLTP